MDKKINEGKYSIMAQGTITGAGNFIIEELKLVTTTGMEIDLRTSIMGLTLFEDMFSFCIHKASAT